MYTLRLLTSQEFIENVSLSGNLPEKLLNMVKYIVENLSANFVLLHLKMF